MTKYREILRLQSLGFSERNIAQSCGVSRNTVAKVLKKAAEINISWPLDFDMTDSGNGDYFAIIDPAFLKAGVSFKVIIHIPDGTDIESDYDKMPECPEIDSVYFILQNLQRVFVNQSLYVLRSYSLIKTLRAFYNIIGS